MPFDRTSTRYINKQNHELVLFALFFGLSIWHGKRVHLHARYLACTVLTVLPPGSA